MLCPFPFRPLFRVLKTFLLLCSACIGKVLRDAKPWGRTITCVGDNSHQCTPRPNCACGNSILVSYPDPNVRKQFRCSILYCKRKCLRTFGSGYETTIILNTSSVRSFYGKSTQNGQQGVVPPKQYTCVTVCLPTIHCWWISKTLVRKLSQPTQQKRSCTPLPTSSVYSFPHAVSVTRQPAYM